MPAAEATLLASVGTAAERASRITMPSSAAVLLLLGGVVLMALGYYGPGPLALRPDGGPLPDLSDRQAGRQAGQAGAGGGGGGGAR